MTFLKPFGLVLGLALAFLQLSASASARDLPPGYQAVSEEGDSKKGELKLVHIFNTEKQKIASIVYFVDGRQEERQFRPGDASLVSREIRNSAGLHLRFEYYPDGKLKKELRNGVLVFERRSLPDGTFEAIRFKSGGLRPQMIRRVGANGEFELTHYRSNVHAVWFKFRLKGASGNPEWEFFALDGSRLRRVISNDQMLVTIYGANGNFLAEQVWKADENGNYSLDSLTLRHAAGLRRYRFDSAAKLLGAEDLDIDGQVVASLKPQQVQKPAKRLLAEYFKDDPTVPESTR